MSDATDPLEDVVSDADIFLATNGTSSSTHMLIIISDGLIPNPGALASATDTAKGNGVVVVVIDAHAGPGVVLWDSYPSSPELLFKVRMFDSVEYVWFILKSCCLGK